MDWPKTGWPKMNWTKSSSTEFCAPTYLSKPMSSEITMDGCHADHTPAKWIKKIYINPI